MAVYRKAEHEARGSAWKAVVADVAPVLPSQAPGCGQAKSSASPRLPAGEKGIEEMVLLAGGGAGAAVLYHELQAIQ